MACLSFIELDKAWFMWSDWLVFCDCGFSVSALWCPVVTPTILLGFLLPWTGDISSWLLQQSAATATHLGRGVSPHHHPSWPCTWSSSSRPSCIVCGKTSDQCYLFQPEERSVSPRISPIAVHFSSVVLTTSMPGVNWILYLATATSASNYKCLWFNE